MLKFKRRYEWRQNARPVDAAALVEQVVAAASGNTSGAIETLETQVSTLTEIVGRLVALLPQVAVVELADRYGYEPQQ